MELIKTAKIKMNIKLEDVLPTFISYTKGFNTVSKIGFASNDKNKTSLHKKTYRILREYLPSQLSCSARCKASEALSSVFTKRKKGEKVSCPHSNLCSIKYDARSYSVSLSKKQVSISTLSGRKKYDLVIPAYYQYLFDNWKRTSAELCVKKGQIFLNISFKKEEVDIPKSGKIIGLDRGINNIAVLSNNTFYGGGIVKKQVRKFQRLRSNLQAVGTKSAKRHLTTLSGKEKRFRADINHKISLQIIASLNPGDILVIENLTGIRKHPMRKEQRILIHQWSFYQLEQFLIYKGLPKGIEIIFINPAYTSQKCSCCGHICKENRKSQSDFCCKKCGFKLNADLNASRNICGKYQISYKLTARADVNQPIVGITKSLTSPCLA